MATKKKTRKVFVVHTVIENRFTFRIPVDSVGGNEEAARDRADEEGLNIGSIHPENAELDLSSYNSAVVDNGVLRIEEEYDD
jgi:hypothetical protein